MRKENSKKREEEFENKSFSVFYQKTAVILELLSLVIF